MIHLPDLDVVSAGAGSGKTYRIKDTVGRWIKEGLVSPDRIVAVTFTEAAAGEIKERLRKELIDFGRVEDALKLDRAYISTIHSFGLRLLTEFSFDGGLPPRSRLLDQNEETALLRQAIARSGNIDTLTRELRRYGYKYDGGTQTSSEDQFRQMVQQVIARLRTVNQEVGGSALSAFSEKSLTSSYGPMIDGNAALDALHRAVTALLGKFPSDISGEFSGNASALKEFRRNFADLSAAQDRDRLETDWHLWGALRKLRQSKRGGPTPDGYDALADAVIEAANELTHHPGPLNDAVNHAQILIRAAVEAVEGYTTDKRKAALVDYTDMVAAAQMTLASSRGALEALAERIDCLVIDEFQDTNPLQFSLLWLLQQAGIPTLIVGDLKQAIMGFQGADPRLMERLLEDDKADTDTLDNNWRTQPSLMPFINSIGSSLFGDEYVSLDPQSDPGFQEPLEILEHPKPPQGRVSKKAQTLRAAERIHELLGDPNQFVRDRQTKDKRRLVAGDIAILCPTNGQMQSYADSLRKFGIKAKIAEAGWIESRIIQIAWHALEYVENPGDKHAALYLACTELGSHGLEPAVSKLVGQQEIDDPVLEQLRSIDLSADYVTVDAVLSQVIQTLDLYGVISIWPDSRKYRADLLRLEAEAKSFVDAKPETLASGGFFGSGVKTFLAWLNDGVERDKEGNQRPDPEVVDEHAVELVSWHRSKGREWPVVFVCGWDSDVKPRLPEVSVEYEKFDDLGDVLGDARISFKPAFAAKETNDRFLAQMQDNVILSAKRLIYVAMTRARERLVLEWHSHLSNSSRTTYYSILTDEMQADIGETEIKIGDDTFPCLMTGNNGTAPDLLDHVDNIEKLPLIGRRAIKPSSLTGPATEIFTTPSSSTREEAATPVSVETYEYGEPLVLDLDIIGSAYGTMLHRCFEVLCASESLASSLPAACGYNLSAEHIDAIARSNRDLVTWLENFKGATSIFGEVPYTVQQADGSVSTGIIDMLVETSGGCLVIDHKTDRATGEDHLFDYYLPQLLSYQKALQSLGKTVIGIGLNLANEGKLQLAMSDQL
jgi:ATP-dependent helicase/nuclease subunit A